VDDDKHAKVMLVNESSQNPGMQQKPKAGMPIATSAEMFGAELVPGTEYLLLGGTRTAIYTWHGCQVKISGPTSQEYDAPNVVMRDYLSCAAVLEQRRQRADDLDLPAPRVLVCGSAFSGKSSLCQVLCNYALRREHTPLFVDLDTRYSNIRQLQGFPACITAMTVEHPSDEEPQRRLSYFFGHVDWTDNPKLYEQLVSHLGKVVLAKLSHGISAEGARVASSGLVINAPCQPTADLLQKIIEMFEVDVVFVLDSEGLHADLSRIYADCPRVNGIPKIEIVPLPKAGGVVQSVPKRLRYTRALRIKDYFYGVMRDFHPYSILVNLDEVQLVQIEKSTLSSSMLPIGQESQQSVEFVARSFSGSPQQLEHALVAVVRANSMNEVLWAPMCGLVLVTAVEENALQLLCPAPPPLPAQYLLVGDFKLLKFVDM
jgi:polyribonucleotide 5'-hydroxyl-kinase